MRTLSQQELSSIVEAIITKPILNEGADLIFDVGTRNAKSTWYVSKEEAENNDYYQVQGRFKRLGDWNDHKPWVKSVGGFNCDICGESARLGFEVAGHDHCIRCFENDTSLFLEGTGYGHKCNDCNDIAKIMFFTSTPTFLKFYPITKEKPHGGVICLPCFEDKAGGVVNYYNELELHLWLENNNMHKDIKVLIP